MSRDKTRDAASGRRGDAEKNLLSPHRPLTRSPHPEIAAWEIKESERMADCRVFQIRRDRSINPRDGSEHDFYCIEAPDWINIVPLTKTGEVVMIEQYRHGTNEVTLEIPGGMVDASESPEEAAARELLEETGYRAREVSLMGRTRPNPAIQNNWIYSYVARDVVFEHQPPFVGTEYTVVRLVPLDRVPSLIADGTINHALVVVGFYWLALQQRSDIGVSAESSVDVTGRPG